MTYPRPSKLCSLALVALFLGPACGPPPDPLASLVALNNGSVLALAEANRRHRSNLQAAFDRHAANCPPQGDPGLLACAQRAGAAAQAELGAEGVRLLMLGNLEHSAADALEAARQCRIGHLDCEAEQMRAVAGLLAQVQAGLLRAVADAGAEGGEGGAP